MIYYGEFIDGLIFVTDFSRGNRASISRSYIYYDNKELCYENTNISSIGSNAKKQKKVYDSILEKIYKRLKNETNYIYKTKNTKKKIKRYVSSTLLSELETLKHY